METISTNVDVNKINKNMKPTYRQIKNLLLQDNKLRKSIFESLGIEYNQPSNRLNEDVSNMMYLMDYNRASTNFESETKRTLIESKVLLNEIEPITLTVGLIAAGTLLTSWIASQSYSASKRAYDSGFTPKSSADYLKFLEKEPWDEFNKSVQETVNEFPEVTESSIYNENEVNVISQQTANQYAMDLWNIMKGMETDYFGLFGHQNREYTQIIQIFKAIPTLLGVSRVAKEYGVQQGGGMRMKNLKQWIEKEFYKDQTKQLEYILSEKPYINYKGKNYGKEEFDEIDEKIRDAYLETMVPADISEPFIQAGYKCVIDTAQVPNNKWEKIPDGGIQITIDGPQGGTGIFKPDGQFKYRGPIFSAGEEELAGEFGCEETMYSKGLEFEDEVVSESYFPMLISEDYPFGDIILDINTDFTTVSSGTDANTPKTKKECSLSDIRNGVKLCYLDAGDEGYLVARVKTILKDKGYAIIENNVYTNDTKETVQKFQEDRGLSPTGIVDMQTLKELETSLNRGEPTAVITDNKYAADKGEFGPNVGDEINVTGEDVQNNTYLEDESGTVYKLHPDEKQKFDRQGRLKSIVTPEYTVKYDVETGMVKEVIYRNRRRNR